MAETEPTARPTVADGIRGGRDREEARRSHQRALRAAVAEAGYDGVLRLASSRGGGYEFSLDPVTGISRKSLGARVEAARMDDATLASEALRLADLAILGRRRVEAVRAAGGDPSSPPAWAFLGHPVMRGVIASRVEDPSSYRPIDPKRWQTYQLTPSVHDMRLGYTGVELQQAGSTVRIDAAGQMARIVIPGDFPEAIVASLPGRALGDVVGLPGLERGTAAGDMPITRGRVGTGHLRVTVDCRLVPLAEAPAGVDAGWLEEWHERHCR